MIKHTIKLAGEEARGARISGRALSLLLDRLRDATLRTLRLRVEGRSHLRGDIKWLEQAADFELVGLEMGSTVLEIESRPLRETAPDIFQQLPLWENQLDEESTALGLFENTLRDAVTGNAESDLLDRPILQSITMFREILNLGFSSMEFGDQRTNASVSVTPEGLVRAERLCVEAPTAFKGIVSGFLEQLTFSKQTFKLRIAGGITLRGILPRIDPSNYAHLWGKKVTIEGEIHFRPSGAVSLIAADHIQAATEGDSLWEHAPRPRPRSLSDLAPRNPLPHGQSGFARIFGRLPEDETNEDTEASLQEIS